VVNDPVNKVDPTGLEALSSADQVDLIVKAALPHTSSLNDLALMPYHASIEETLTKNAAFDSQYSIAPFDLQESTTSLYNLIQSRVQSRLTEEWGWGRIALATTGFSVINAGQKRDGAVETLRHPIEARDRAVAATSEFISHGMIDRGDSSRGLLAIWDGLGYELGSGTGLKQIGEGIRGVDLNSRQFLTTEERWSRGLEGVSTLSLTAAGFAGSYDPVLATGKLDHAVTFYHATSAEAATAIRKSGIDLRAGRVDVDFGQGFYTSTNLAQVREFASVVKGFDEIGILEYRVSASRLGELSSFTYESPSIGWGMFVKNNRLSLSAPHSFDLITGPVLKGSAATIKRGVSLEIFEGYNQTVWFNEAGLTLLEKGLQK